MLSLMQELQAQGSTKIDSEQLLQAAVSLEQLKMSFETQLSHLVPATPTLPSYDFANLHPSFLSNLSDLQSTGGAQLPLCDDIVPLLGKTMHRSEI